MLTVIIWSVSEPYGRWAYFGGDEGADQAKRYARILARFMHDGVDEECGTLTGNSGALVIKAKDGAQFHITPMDVHGSAETALVAYGGR
jgi:hypothetical protein